MSSTTRQGNKKQPGQVSFVGVGPGDERLLTLRGADVISAAETLVGRPAQLARFAHLAGDAERLELPDEGDADAVAKQLVAAARDGRRVVRLVAGDPGATAHTVDEIEHCARSRCALELVPGVGEATGVASYAGVLPTRRGAHVVLVDADAGDALTGDALTGLAAGLRHATVVATGTPAALTRVAAALAEDGRASTPAMLTTEGTTTAQRSVDTDLAGAAALLEQGIDAARAVLVVGDAVAHRERSSWFESKSLFGWRVLVPRTREQSAALCDRLRSYGAVPVEVPTIAVEPPRTPQAVDRAINGLVSGRYQWVAFTSTNAVRAVREKIEQLGLDARAFAGVKVAAVGEATAAAIEAWGIRPDLTPGGEQSSEGLVADWPEYEPGIDPLDRVFLPRADIATETLAAGLLERGWQVDDVTAYRTVRAAPPPAPTREAIKTGGFDAVLFTSSSTVRNLVGIAGKPHTSTVIAVIGPQTAKTAEELGLRVDVVAPSPSALTLADALAEYGHARRLAEGDMPPGKANRARAASRPVKKAK